MALFQDVKFYLVSTCLTDENKQKVRPADSRLVKLNLYIVGVLVSVKDMLVANGGRQSSYLTDSVTLVVADSCDSSDVGEAKDIYNIPVVTRRWVEMSLKSGQRLPFSQFAPDVNNVFTNCVFAFADEKDMENLYMAVGYNGGDISEEMRVDVTHLVSSDGSNMRCKTVVEAMPHVKVVTPSWLHESIKRNCRLNESDFHPLGYQPGHVEERERVAQAEAIQCLVASLKMEAQQIAQSNSIVKQPTPPDQQHQQLLYYDHHMGSGVQESGPYAQQGHPSEDHSMYPPQYQSQEPHFKRNLHMLPATDCSAVTSNQTGGGPSSPLVPLDPTRLRELVVERQQTPSSMAMGSTRPSPDHNGQQSQSTPPNILYPPSPGGRVVTSVAPAQHMGPTTPISNPQGMISPAQSPLHNPMQQQQRFFPGDGSGMVSQQHVVNSPGQNMGAYGSQASIRNVTPPPSVIRLPMPQSPQQQQQRPVRSTGLSSVTSPQQQQFQQQQQYGGHQMPPPHSPYQQQPPQLYSPQQSQLHSEPQSPHHGYQQQSVTQQIGPPFQQPQSPQHSQPPQYQQQYGGYVQQPTHMQQGQYGQQPPQSYSAPQQQQTVQMQQHMQQRGAVMQPPRASHPQQQQQQQQPQIHSNIPVNYPQQQGRGVQGPVGPRMMSPGQQPQGQQPQQPGAQHIQQGIPPRMYKGQPAHPQQQHFVGQQQTRMVHPQQQQIGIYSGMSPAQMPGQQQYQQQPRMMSPPPGMQQGQMGQMSSSQQQQQQFYSQQMPQQQQLNVGPNLNVTQSQVAMGPPPSSQQQLYQMQQRQQQGQPIPQGHPQQQQQQMYQQQPQQPQYGMQPSQQMMSPGGPRPIGGGMMVSSLPQQQHFQAGQPQFSTGQITVVPPQGFVTGAPQSMKSPGAAQMSPAEMQNLAGGQMLSPTGAMRISAGPTQNVPLSQPQRIQYFGHEHGITVPPDVCLVGCVFLIVDYDRLLDQKEVGDWKLVIVQNGGEVETSYSQRVTHVVCESLRHPVVHQAVKDNKRCVTAQWLNDCVLKKTMIPPWKAIHFPSQYGDNKPCKDRIFCVTGFDGNDRNCLKQMILAVGARYTGYFCANNSLLVAKRLEGTKVVKAAQWNIPVVGVQWLADLVMGNAQVIHSVNHQRYKPQANPDPFRIDLNVLPPCLMQLLQAWCIPVSFNQDVWKSAADRKHKLDNDDGKIFQYKKLKLSPAPDDSDIAQSPAEKPSADRRPIVLFTGLYKAEVDNLIKKLQWLGGGVTDDVSLCTYVVAADLKRTLKLLKAISLGLPVVSSSWIKQSYKQQRFIDHKEFLIKDEGNEKFFGFNLKLSLYKARKKKLFENMMFYLTPGISPGASVLRDVISAAGGSVLKTRPASQKLLEFQQKNINIVIVTCDNDLHLCTNLLKRNIAVYSVEFVLTGVLRQEVDFVSYKIEPKPPQNGHK